MVSLNPKFTLVFHYPLCYLAKINEGFINNKHCVEVKTQSGNATISLNNLNSQAI